MTDNTPALPVTEAGRALLATLRKFYSPNFDRSAILAIEAEAAQARDAAWRASLTAWTVPAEAEAAQARDDEFITRDECATLLIEAVRGATQIEPDRG